MNRLILLVIIFSFSLFAQQVRSLNNDGVDLYKKGKYSEAEVNFKKGVEKQPESFKANFNLGDSYYKQGRFDEAIKSYETALKASKENDYSAKTYHNLGNSLLKIQETVQDPQQRSKMLQQSIESYKNSLKLNPDDRETKYNLSYALSLLDKNKQQQNNKDQKNKDDQNKDQQQNQDKQNQDKQNQDKKDQQNKDQQNKDQQKPDQNQETKQDNLKQPDKNKISKEEAERILQALKNNEKDLQKKLRKVQGKKVKTEKDW